MSFNLKALSALNRLTIIHGTMTADLLLILVKSTADFKIFRVAESSVFEIRRFCRFYRQFLRQADNFWPTVGPNVRRVQRVGKNINCRGKGKKIK